LSDGPIGVLSEGAGGAAIARAIQARMPSEDVVLLIDGAYAPYARRPSRVVLDRAPRMAAELASAGIKALVIASLQATADALSPIASAVSVPVLALDATLAHAAVRSPAGRIGGIWAAGTLREGPWLRANRFVRGGGELVPGPWPELRETIDAGRLPTEAATYLAGIRDQGVDVLALLCPYAVAARPAIEAAAAGLTIVDAGDVVAERLRAHLVRTAALVRGRRRSGRIQTIATDPSATFG
jgi:glutamate racemase